MQASGTEVGELVDRARSGDAAAFAQLIRLFERTALALAHAALGDANLAADVVQEAFVKAWQRLAELKEPQRFAAWLSRMVRNAAIDARRRRSVLKFQPLDAVDAGHLGSDRHDPAGQFQEREQQRELRRRLDAALGSLDELTRSAVTLRYYEGLSSKQIGELLELSPAAIDMRLSRARAELRQLLTPVADKPQSSPAGAEALSQ